MDFLKVITDKDVGLDTPAPAAYQDRKAGRAIIFDDERNIALLHVSKKKFHKLPGGGVEEGEDVVQALRRETMEEIGCEIQNLRELGAIEEYRNGSATHQISYCYIADLSGGKGVPEFTQEEIDDRFEVVWMGMEQAIKILEEETQTVDDNEGKFITTRELIFLTETKRINNMVSKRTQNSWIDLILLIGTVVAAVAGVWAVVVGYQGIDQQEKFYQKTKADQEYPFFQYLYEPKEKFFRVSGYDYVRINSVEWSLPDYDNGTLTTMSALTKDLYWVEIRDFYAERLSQKLQEDKAQIREDMKFIQEDTECLFFAYVPEGIPAIVEVNYDLRDQLGLISRDLVLISRLDTSSPVIQYKSKIDTEEKLTELLNEYRLNVELAYRNTKFAISGWGSTSSSKSPDGTCGVQFNQPNFRF